MNYTLEFPHNAKTHSCYFNFNEDVLTKGIEVFVRILEQVGGFIV